MLFMVVERGWGYSYSVVRADDAEQAKQMAGASRRSVEVIPLPVDGPPGVIWCEEESPDTPRDRD